MIYKKGNLFDCPGAGIIAHGCNAQGVMGSGVAYEFRRIYPQAYEKYQRDIQRNGLKLGGISWCFEYVDDTGMLLASAITQEFYGVGGKRYVSYDAIDSCFRDVIAGAIFSNMVIHIPKIGAGLGGGDWDIISNIIEVNAEKQNFDQNKIFVWEL